MAPCLLNPQQHRSFPTLGGRQTSYRFGRGAQLASRHAHSERLASKSEGEVHRHGAMIPGGPFCVATDLHGRNLLAPRLWNEAVVDVGGTLVLPVHVEGGGGSYPGSVSKKRR